MKTYPIIKSFKEFKLTTRKFNTVSLWYGFDKEICMGVKSLKEAYNKYKEHYNYYDSFITKNGFLMDSKVEKQYNREDLINILHEAYDEGYKQAVETETEILKYLGS